MLRCGRVPELAFEARRRKTMHVHDSRAGYRAAINCKGQGAAIVKRYALVLEHRAGGFADHEESGRSPRREMSLCGSFTDIVRTSPMAADM
jgi:hypothetical protein